MIKWVKMVNIEELIKRIHLKENQTLVTILLSRNFENVLFILIYRLIKVILLQALLALGLFIFIHMVFVREPVDCLSHVHDIWPKNGILRVEIIKNSSNDYTLNESYRKFEESFHLTDTDLIDLHETGKTG